jgi:hypothetical protein
MRRHTTLIRKLVFNVGPPAHLPTSKLAFLAGCFACACVSGHSFAIGQEEDAQLSARLSATTRGNAILPAAILAASRTSAYDAAIKLRPGFFTNNRSAGSGREPVHPSVILERGQIEPLDILRSVSVDVVREIEFIEPDDARTRYGSAYSAGIIVVRLTKAP